MFRYKRSIPVSEDKQGYVYYASRLYSQMDRKGREAIHRLCQAAGGEYSEALLEFVTTDATATAIWGCETSSRPPRRRHQPETRW